MGDRAHSSAAHEKIAVRQSCSGFHGISPAMQPLIHAVVAFVTDDEVAVQPGRVIALPDFVLSEMNRYHDTSPSV
jgi:hypothetical protein